MEQADISFEGYCEVAISVILFSSSLPNILNATNDYNSSLQIASEKLIHPSLNGTRVVITNFKSTYLS